MTEDVAVLPIEDRRRRNGGHSNRAPRNHNKPNTLTARYQKDPLHDQAVFWDNVLQASGLPSDSRLAKRLEVHPSMISKVRHGYGIVSNEMILAVHCEFDIPVATLKEWAGMKKFVAQPIPEKDLFNVKA